MWGRSRSRSRTGTTTAPQPCLVYSPPSVRPPSPAAGTMTDPTDGVREGSTGARRDTSASRRTPQMDAAHRARRIPLAEVISPQIISWRYLHLIVVGWREPDRQHGSWSGAHGSVKGQDKLSRCRLDENDPQSCLLAPEISNDRYNEPTGSVYRYLRQTGLGQIESDQEGLRVRLPRLSGDRRSLKRGAGGAAGKNWVQS